MIRSWVLGNEAHENRNGVLIKIIYAKITNSIMKGVIFMKQVKMNLSDELEDYFKSHEDCKKKQNLKKACKTLFILGGGIGCFMLGDKYSKLCITRGMNKIYSNYPDVQKAMFESLKDYCIKNNLKLK